MCPDKSLLSAYVDGELDPVWKGKIDAHIRTCSACQAVLNKYGALETLLRTAGEGIRSERMDEVLEAVLSSGRHRQRIWKQSFSIPAPIALAAAALFMILGALFFSIIENGSRASSPFYEISSSGSHGTYTSKNLTPFADLASQEEDSDLVISLPETGGFSVSGEPRFLLATEYRRGK